MAAAADQTKPREGSTRERLLQVAIEMFAERGYAATGVDALCRKAGVAKTGLYWEFQNKVGLLNAVIDRVMQEWADAIAESALNARDPRERLDLSLQAVRTRIKQRPELFRVILVVLAERTQVDEEARHALQRFFDAARASMAGAIQEAITTAVPPEQLSVIADITIAMVEGIFLRLQIYGDEHLDQLFDGVRRAILLLVRETLANAQGYSTLIGPVLGVAKPLAS